MTDPSPLFPGNVADTVRDVTMMATAPTDLAPGALLGAVAPDDWTLQVTDLERYAATPNRKRGNPRVDDVDSFLAYIEHQHETLHDVPAEALPSIWLQPDGLQAVAVFDDHTADGPGWRDHTATLKLKRTREWLAWAGIDRGLLTAGEFADFVDEWRHTISDPPTADLLDIVRNFRAVKRVTYAKEIVDRNGDVSLEWTEETQASGGKSVSLEIPEGFMLVMAPFEGAEVVQLRARFRYTVSDGTARFGVILDQPDKLLRDAFDGEVARIRYAAPFVVMVGQPDLTA